MAGLMHVFSHFKLHIEPWYLQAGAPIAAEPAPRQAWIPVADLSTTALPAPVKKILTGLFPAGGNTPLPDQALTHRRRAGITLSRPAQLTKRQFVMETGYLPYGEEITNPHTSHPH